MEEVITQENFDYSLVSLTKYFAVPYISVCPQVRYLKSVQMPWRQDI